MTDDAPVLKVRDLEKYFNQSSNVFDMLRRGGGDQVQAVDGITIELGHNESRGIVGESGCGKSTLLRTLLGLYEPTGGTIYHRGRDISEFGRAEWKEYRSDVQIIFQDPFNSLDPKMTVRETLLEPLKVHGLSDRENRLEHTLRQVELDPPDEYLDRGPAQLSGGEKQRVAIARALIVEPEIILADEPVSMLDVSTQASVLGMLSQLIDDYGVSMLYISHDLSTVSYICDRIEVMYMGRIVESAPTNELLSDPKHPYAQALIEAIPIPDPHHDRARTPLEGSPPEPINIGEGCRFRDRCPEAMDVCERTPIDYQYNDERTVACHLYYEHETDAGSKTVANQSS